MTETFVPAHHTALMLTTEIVSAFVSKTSISTSQLPHLIQEVHGALMSLSGAAPVAEPELEKPTPAEIKKTIKPDGLISFIDGRPYKTLKRHLSSHGLDPDSYRARFGLPADYPMTAPSYSARRSELAKQLGLGVQHRQAAE